VDGLHKDRTLLVDGLPLSYCADDLKRIFAAHGNVVWARIVRDPMGMSLGLGYVAMGDESEAISALDALNGKSLCERILLVVQADAPSLPRRP